MDGIDWMLVVKGWMHMGCVVEFTLYQSLCHIIDVVASHPTHDGVIL